MAAALQESRQQVERLAGLLWQTLPSERPTSWLTQRQLMDRLQEEVSRAERYGTPLTVVLGQLAGPVGAGPEPVSPWVAERIGRAKRRCDVAGPYGPHGFLLLLVHTAESGAVACCRRLRDVLSRPSGPGEDLRGPVRPYFGIAGYSKAVSSANRLLRLAEQHLEAAKTERGGLVVAV